MSNEPETRSEKTPSELAQMSDEDIDFSDIQELDDDFLNQATVDLSDQNDETSKSATVDGQPNLHGQSIDIENVLLAPDVEHVIPTVPVDRHQFDLIASPMEKWNFVFLVSGLFGTHFINLMVELYSSTKPTTPEWLIALALLAVILMSVLVVDRSANWLGGRFKSRRAETWSELNDLIRAKEHRKRHVVSASLQGSSVDKGGAGHE